jgi:DNA-binding MarR family transcriptional regulator
VSSAAQNRLAGLLKRAQVRLVEGFGAVLATYGIDGRELAVLVALADHGPKTQQEVSVALGIDRTTMVALVDVLEEKGFVRRRPHPSDRRKNLLDVTGAGREITAVAAPAVHEAERAFLAPLAPGEADELRRMLRLLIEAP